MKNLMGLILVLILLPVCANAEITDVSILPSPTIDMDSITILANGYRTWDNEIVDTDFSINNNILQLDIYIQTGYMPAEYPWSYSEEIGTLSAGLYNLSVNEYARMYGSWVIADTHSVSFEVTPEPTTIILFALGLPVFRRFTRKVASR